MSSYNKESISLSKGLWDSLNLFSLHHLHRLDTVTQTMFSITFWTYDARIYMLLYLYGQLYVTFVPVIELCYSCMNGCNIFYFMTMSFFHTVSFSA